MTYDVIIVGAGPSGSTAARELASRGRRVLVLERDRHPRRKVCGGCLSSRIDKLLGTRFHKVIERSVREVVFAYSSERYFYHRSTSAFAYLVRRERLDHYLAEEAARAGAEIRENEPAIDVEEGTGGVRVTTSGGRYEAAYLVGADGVSSLVARRLGLSGGRLLGLAREADIEWPMGAAAKNGGVLTIGMGDVPFGYGWVFPKGGSVSVGVAGQRDRVGDIKDLFDSYLHRQGRLADVGGISPAGYFLASAANGQTPIRSSRSLLVGDAAGFADPLLGEGIYYSVRSGLAAARVIDGALDGSVDDIGRYRHLLEEDIFDEFDAARLMAGIFYRFPQLGYHILEKGDVIEGFCDVLRGGSTYREQSEKVRSICAPEILRYLGVLRPAERNGGTQTPRSTFLGRGIRRIASGVNAPRVKAHLRELIREHVLEGATILNIGARTDETERLLNEASNPPHVVNLATGPETDARAQRERSGFRVSGMRGDFLRLPFRASEFDVVICAGGIERLRDPRAAVREFLRVVRPGGAVIYTFSALPTTGRGRLAAYLLEHMSDLPFLPSGEQPFHRCEVSRLMESAGGMLKVAVLGKCCNVDEPLSPCGLVAENPRGSRPNVRSGEAPDCNPRPAHA